MPLIKVKTSGLDQLIRAAGRAPSEVDAGARRAVKSVAELVARRAQGRVPTGPGAGGHARSSINVVGKGEQAVVNAGQGFPYFGWLDFGGRVGIRGSVSRPFLNEGRYVYKAYKDQRQEAEQLASTEIKKAIRSAGMDIT
jgi:hypothetical protein